MTATQTILGIYSNNKSLPTLVTSTLPLGYNVNDKIRQNI